MAVTDSMIRQLDVFRNPLRAGREDRPYLLCIQHHLLHHLNTRVMAPLVTAKVIREQSRLYPAIRVGRNVVYFDPTDLMTLPVRLLREPITNAEAERDRIIAALDLVLTGA